MFTSKNFFSDVACPYQQDCLLPGCIFGHPDQIVSAETTASQIQDHASGQDQRKQQNTLENQRPGHDSEHGMETTATLTSKYPLKGMDQKLKHRGLYTDREISPPPLKRKALNGTAIPVEASVPHDSNLKTQSISNSSSSLTTKPIAKTPVKVPPKKEALNPRPLKYGAPAKHDFRYKLVKALHEHLTRLNSELARDANDEEEQLVLSDQDLITKALDIEESATHQPTIYSNVVKNRILVYKKMTVANWKAERETELKKGKAAEAALLSNTPISKISEPPKLIETGLSLDEELQILPRLYTPVSGLSKHGYVNSIPTNQDIEVAKQGIEAAKGWEVCDRCKSRFQVFPGRREEDGALASGGSCTYHFGKVYWQDLSATDPNKAKREKKYRCCGQSMGDSPGCTQADSHVFKISEVKRMAAILNFEKTPKNPEKLSNKPVCIDGEMGYTVFGLELIRLTATSWPDGEALFDVLVRPIGPVLDLNSRYSGVWPKDMAEAVPRDASTAIDDSTVQPGTKRQLRIVDSPAAARALLFSHISPETPIIGHGLENDLNATRIIHPTIIDTALLFPHKAGLPYRNGLKMLTHTHLNRHIQVIVDGKMGGHDSKEDANAAGDLVRFALASEWQKMQREGWLSKDGKIIPPPAREQPVNAPASNGRKRLRDEMERSVEGDGAG